MSEEVEKLRRDHVDELVNAKNAVQLVKEQMRDLGKNEMKQIKQIVIQQHLRPSLKRPGLFNLVSLKTQEHLPAGAGMEENDRHMLQAFMAQVKNIRSNIRNITADFSTWQTTLSEHKRMMKNLSNRVEQIED